MSLGLRRSFKLKFGCTTVHTGNVCGFIGGPSERTCLKSRRVNGGARAGGGGWRVREDLPSRDACEQVEAWRAGRPMRAGA